MGGVPVQAWVGRSRPYGDAAALSAGLIAPTRPGADVILCLDSPPPYETAPAHGAPARVTAARADNARLSTMGGHRKGRREQPCERHHACPTKQSEGN